jgi:hypothetical protein
MLPRRSVGAAHGPLPSGGGREQVAADSSEEEEGTGCRGYDSDSDDGYHQGLRGGNHGGGGGARKARERERQRLLEMRRQEHFLC